MRLQSVETVYLIADSIGSSRGEVAMRLLLEMNHEVRGDFVEETVEQVCHGTHFSKFNFSIWSQNRLDRPKNLSCYFVLHISL
jgi:hypothetical protein